MGWGGGGGGRGGREFEQGKFQKFKMPGGLPGGGCLSFKLIDHTVAIPLQ